MPDFTFGFVFAQFIGFIMKRIISLVLALATLTAFLSACEQTKPEETTVGSDSTTAATVTDDPTESGSSDSSVSSLRVNYEKNPSGVDDTPCFSWVMSSELRGVAQTAYRVKVAKSSAQLSSGELVWDSGKIKSDASILVPCTAELSAATKYYWSVEVTDGEGKIARSSEEAYFVTGLMKSGFDGAEWITQDTHGSLSGGGINGCGWIWLSNGADFGKTPAGTEYFRRSFTVDKTVESAYLYFTADDYGTLYLNGAKAGEIANATDSWKYGKIVDISDMISSGNNVLAAKVVNAESGYAGLICRVLITYADGTTVNILTDKNWLVSNTAATGWETTGYDDSGWSKPDQNVANGETPWFNNVSLSQSSTGGDAAPMLRGEFNVEKTVKSAYLFSTAAGLYNVYINGSKVAADYLDPGRTEYDKRIMYQSYDVTGMLTEGGNAIGAMLGRGWYIGAYSPYGATIPAFICKLVIEYTDGSTQTVVSDGNWKYTLSGPITYNDIFNGETYDTGREIDGWCSAGFDASKWGSVETALKSSLGIGEIVAQLSGEVKTMDTLTAVSVTKVGTEKFIYDFGQNFAGVVSVTLTGSAGDVITLRHGEMLNDGSAGSDGKKGTLYTTNLRSAAATDTYTLKGTSGGETYTPSFTFHGFRYVEISGVSEALPLENVKGLVLYSDMEDSGTLSTSSELVNQLISNTYWGQRSNFLSTPTDCPQRDERMGWSGDAQVFAGTAAYNMNVKTFFDKYITDLNDCQRSNGAYPDVAPQTNRAAYTGSGNSGWGDAGVIIPWIMYTRYGDISYIEKYYSNMSKYIKYLVSVSNNYLKANSAYGDWLSVGESTPVGVTDTAYCAYVSDLMSKMATLLGKDSDAKSFSATSQKFKDAWCKAYLKDSGALTANSQTAYVMAVYFKLVPEDMLSACAEYLNKKTIRNNYTLTTGFLGVSYLLPVLCDYGYIDTAFRLLEQTNYPSWLYPVLQGATTIWERWNSYTLDSGFGDAGMNSFNHYSYGSVTEWMYSYMAGIKCDENAPGFKHFFLQPLCGGTITNVTAAYESIYGKIESAWTGADGVMKTYTCTVPANTTATLTLRVDDALTVLESGSALDSAKGITVVSRADGILKIELTSGTYSFTMN